MKPWLEDPDITLYHGDNLDVLRTLPDKSVHMCATSPPFYGLRDYGTGEWEGGNPDCDHRRMIPQGTDSSSSLEGGPSRSPYIAERQICTNCGARRVDQQIGLEETPDQWVANLVAVFREVRRVLRDDGTLWVEIGDSYSGGGAGSPQRDTSGGFGGRDLGTRGVQGYTAASSRSAPTPAGYKQKDLLGQPWLLAFALRADGWWLRSEIIWARPNPMPESVTDRPTKSHSTVFLLSKNPRYFYDADAIREPHTDSNTSRLAALQKNGEAWTEKVPAATNPDSPYYSHSGAVRGAPGVGTQFRGFNASGANARSVWTIPTQPTPFAHFATWPEALCRRMILAGTSEKGCCPECGAPWVRDVETTRGGPSTLAGRIDQGGRQSDYHATGGNFQPLGKAGGSDTRGMPSVSVQTLGWSPSCTHDTHPVPCTVLDPFAGSATTCLVARNHGRHSIGIELNAEYLKIAAKRLQQLSLLA